MLPDTTSCKIMNLSLYMGTRTFCKMPSNNRSNNCFSIRNPALIYFRKCRSLLPSRALKWGLIWQQKRHFSCHRKRRAVTSGMPSRSFIFVLYKYAYASFSGCMTLRWYPAQGWRYFALNTNRESRMQRSKLVGVIPKNADESDTCSAGEKT